MQNMGCIACGTGELNRHINITPFVIRLVADDQGANGSGVAGGIITAVAKHCLACRIRFGQDARHR
jgi:hypothetical protein